LRLQKIQGSPEGGRTKAIALWSGLGGAIAALGPLLSGWLLEHFYWGSVFLITLPLAVVAIVMAHRFVPAHVQEGTEPVDKDEFPPGRSSFSMIATLTPESCAAIAAASPQAPAPITRTSTSACISLLTL